MNIDDKIAVLNEINNRYMSRQLNMKEAVEEILSFLNSTKTADTSSFYGICEECGKTIDISSSCCRSKNG